jgi:transposase-like protein
LSRFDPRLDLGSGRPSLGHHYLKEYKCPVCGWTLTYDHGGPTASIPWFTCDNCKRKGFRSFLVKTNDGN